MIRPSTRWDRKERVNVESDLKFDNTANQAIEIQGATQILRNGSVPFTHCFFIDNMTDLSGFPMIYAESNNPEKGIEIFLSSFAAETVSLTLRFIGTIGQDNHTYTNIPISLLTTKTHFACIFKSDLATASNSETSLYINGKLYQTKTAFTSGGCLQSLTSFKIGSFPNGNLPFSGSISHYQMFNRELTPQEISFIHIQGGLVPESAHEACVFHQGLNQRQYFKASAAFIVKHPQFALDDLVSVDFVEQYNYAKPNYNVDALSTWALNGGFSVTTEQLTYDGTQGGTRVASDLVNNLPFGDFKFIKVRFNVVSNTSTFWVFIGGSTTAPNRVAITGTGIKEISLFYEAGAATMFFGNTDGVDFTQLAAVWTVDQVEILPLLKANHGELINFTNGEVLDSPVSSVKDFYKKNTQIGYLGTTTFDGRTFMVNQAVSPIVADGDFTAYSEFIMWVDGAFITLGGAAFYIQGQSKKLFISGHTIEAVVMSPPLKSIDNLRRGKAVLRYDNLAQEIKVFLSYEGGGSGEFVFTQSVPTLTTTYYRVGWPSGGVAFSNDPKFSGYKHSILYDVALSDSECREMIKKTSIFPASNKVVEWTFGIGNKTDALAVDYIKDLSGNNNHGTILLPHAPTEKEKHYQQTDDSLLPDIKQAWKGLHNVDYISLPLQPFKDVANSDITIAVTMWMDRDTPILATTPIFRTLGGTNGNLWIYFVSTNPTRFRAGLITPNTVILSTTELVEKSWQTFFFTKKGNAFDSIAANKAMFVEDGIKKSQSANFIPDSNIVDWSTITEVRGYNDNGYCARIGLWNRVLSEKEMKELGNNNLFKNPTIEQQKDLKGYWLFNGVIDNGGTAEFQDYGPDQLNAIVVGQTVGEAQSALIDINELR